MVHVLYLTPYCLLFFHLLKFRKYLRSIIATEYTCWLWSLSPLEVSPRPPSPRHNKRINPALLCRCLISLESGNVHRMPPRCFSGCIPALQPGTVSEEEMREIEPTELPQKWGFLDSGNGTAPRCLKVALSDQTSPLPRGLFGPWAHLDWHQSVTLFKGKHIRTKKPAAVRPPSDVLSLQKKKKNSAGRLRRHFYLQLHLSWSSCGCNLSWSRCWWWRQISD